MCLPLYPSTGLQLVKDAAQCYGIECNQSPERALCHPLVLRQSEQRSTVRQIQLPITLVKAPVVEATGVDEIKFQHAGSL
jgi:hypothetical protein